MRLKLIGIVALSCILTSCEFVERVIYSDEIVARAGSSVLYREQLRRVTEPGMNASDSLKVVVKYIENWCREELLVQKAEKELSKEALDVSRELESYRRALLMYRYEQMYVAGRLDTVVTDIEAEEYYVSNQREFVAESPLVRGFLLKMRTDSPNIKKTVLQMRSLKDTDTDEMESLATMVSYGYSNFYDYWLSLKEIAVEYGLVLDDLEKMSGKNVLMTIEQDGFTYLIRVWDMIPQGEIMPFDYCFKSVKERILTKRKAGLLSNLERELLSESEFL